MKTTARAKADPPALRPAAAVARGHAAARPSAVADDRRESIAQREKGDDLASSPYVVAQRQRFQSMFGARVKRQGWPDQGNEPARHLSATGHAQAPVQRLIGFEVEYQVPTFGPPTQDVTLWPDAADPDQAVDEFLFGGMKYGTKLGGSAKRGENSFRITTDHKGAISREPIRAGLAAMGLLSPDKTKDPDGSSNLEYVTSPVDELAKGSDKVLGTMIDKVAKHATDTFGLASKDMVSPLSAPAAGVKTGTPDTDIWAWLSDKNYEQIQPTIKQFRNQILDRCYVQATVGILPSAIGALFTQARTGGLHKADETRTEIYDAVSTVTGAVRDAIKEHEFIKGLQRSKDTESLYAITGMVRLLASYLIGEALSQTEAFPGGSIKNAVPFLVKIDPAKLSDTFPGGLFFGVADDLLTVLAAELSQREEFKVKYWRDLGYASRDREANWVTSGSIKDLAKLFLQGKTPGTDLQTGSTLPSYDPMTEINKSGVDSQGIPLEYRYVEAHPTAAGLKAELMKLVAEARAINLTRVSEGEKTRIEQQVKA